MKRKNTPLHWALAAQRAVRGRLKSLDSLHVTLICLLALMSGVGWFAACECDKARHDAAAMRDSYRRLSMLYHNQVQPPQNVKAIPK